MLFDKLFLVVIALLLLLETAFTDDTGKDCEYDGEIDPAIIDQLNSEDFQATLSPFNELFLSEIPSADFFFKFFQTKFEKSTAERAFFLNCVHYGDKMGLNCPSIIDTCKQVGQSGASAVENGLSPIDYFMIRSNTLQAAFEEKGDLQSFNASSIRHMIKTYLNDVASYLCSPGVQGPSAALFALTDGAVKFYSRLGVTDQNDIAHIAEVFANELSNFGSQGTTTTLISDAPVDQTM